MKILPLKYRMAQNFRNYTVITKILFTKFSSQLIILDATEAQGEFGIK